MGSERTYEELKHTRRRIHHQGNHGSERTYEELKPIFPEASKTISVSRSERTYEELKPPKV